MSVFIIAECGSSWRFGADHLANAYRMIDAAKSAGADAVKFQWCSNGRQLAIRRSGKPHEYDQGGCGEDQCLTCLQGEDYDRYINYDPSWLPLLKAHAVKVGIQFGVTAFLPQDVAVVAPLVDFFKIAAMECDYIELANATRTVRGTRPTYVSTNADHQWEDAFWDCEEDFILHCVSKYPCPIDEISISEIHGDCKRRGLSDHTAHVLTGAVAVGAGAKIVESHIRLQDTPPDNPDYPHSLEVDYPFSEGGAGNWNRESYAAYVQNIRIAERMM